MIKVFVIPAVFQFLVDNYNYFFQITDIQLVANKVSFLLPGP